MFNTFSVPPSKKTHPKPTNICTIYAQEDKLQFIRNGMILEFGWFNEDKSKHESL